MSDYKFLKSMTEANFYCETYAEYLLACADDYTQLLSAVDAAISIEDINYTIPGTSSPITSNDALFEQVDAFLDLFRRMSLDSAKSLALEDGIDLEEISIYSDTAIDYVKQGIQENSYTIRQFLTDDAYYWLHDNVKESGWLDRNFDALYSGFEDLINAFDSDIYSRILNQGFGDPNLDSGGVFYPKYVPFNEGYIKLKDLIFNVWLNANKTFSTIHDSLSDVKLFTNINTLIPNVSLSLSEIITQIKTNLESVVTLAASFKTISIQNISDRITRFNEIAASFLSNVRGSFSNFTNTIREKISDAAITITQFKDWVIDLVDISTISDEDDKVYNDTKSVTFTGANPMLAVDFSTLKKATIAAGKMAATVTKSIISSTIDLIDRLFTTVENKINTTLIDPIDCVELNNGSKSGLIDTYCYEFDNNLILMDDAQGDNTQVLYDNWAKFSSHWIKMSTIYGEVLIQPDRMSPYGSQGGLMVECHIKFKPRPLSHNMIRLLSEITSSITKTVPSTDRESFTFDYSTLIDINTSDALLEINTYVSNTEGAYCDATASEEELLLGFELSIMLFKLNIAAQSIWDQARDLVYDDSFYGNEEYNCSCPYGVVYYNNNGGVDPPTISNLDFFKEVTGYDGSTYYDKDYVNQLRWITAGSPGSSNAYSLKNCLTALFSFYCNAFVDRIINPSSFEFLPYSNNHTDFSTPQWRIKSDSENQAAATRFLTIVVGVVLAVAAIAITFTAIRLHKIKRYAKVNQKIGVKDSKMWEGKQLNFFEKLSYYRNNRKLEKMNLVGSGLSILSTTAQATDNLNTIQSNIFDITEKSSSNWKYDNDQSLRGQIENNGGETDLIQDVIDLIH